MAVTRIALFSDTHISHEETERQSLFRVRLAGVVQSINGAKVDFALCGGDLMENALPEEARAAFDLIQPLQVPVRFVPGNHDIGNKPLPDNSYETKDEWLDGWEASVGPCFFMEQIAGVRVIGLTGSLFGSSLPRNEVQWMFLEREATRPQSGPTVLLVHYPPFLARSDEPGDYWNISSPDRERLLDLASMAGVSVALSGHTHRPIVNHHRDILLLTTPPVSFNLTGAPRQLGWTLLILHPDGKVETEFRWMED
ncbi:MAG: metallophosphoesterase [Armatimonadota bacterium]|nr:metallophosphoesterase [Armatimonadota bacterium]